MPFLASNAEKPKGSGCDLFAYCLFCRTQKAHAVARQLEKQGFDRAFCPQNLNREKRKGVFEERYFDLLPGYVFAFSEQPIANFAALLTMDGVIKPLRYDRAPDAQTAQPPDAEPTSPYLLRNADLDFAMKLYRMNGKLGEVPVFKVGDKVRIAIPLFEGYQGTIVALDQRKQRAKISYHFDGNDCFAWVACRMVEGEGATVFGEWLNDALTVCKITLRMLRMKCEYKKGSGVSIKTHAMAAEIVHERRQPIF